MERLTKKNPGTNLERLLNFAIAKDKQVVLDYGFEKKPLVQVVVEKAKEIGCDASEQAVMWEGQCMECDCAVALMNMLAVQAAELHARLSKIEDILGDDYDLDRLAAIMNQRMSMREDVAERWKLTSDIPIDRLRELAQADREGRCVGGLENVLFVAGCCIFLPVFHPHPPLPFLSACSRKHCISIIPLAAPPYREGPAPPFSVLWLRVR